MPEVGGTPQQNPCGYANGWSRRIINVDRRVSGGIFGVIELPFSLRSHAGLRGRAPSEKPSCVSRPHYFRASVSVAPAAAMAFSTAGGGRVSVTTIIRGPKGAVRLNAFRPNFEASSAKIVRSAAAIILR